MGGPNDETTYTYGDGYPMNASRGGIGISGGGWGGASAVGGHSWDYDGESWQPGQPSLTWGKDYVGVNSKGGLVPV